ncbi:Zinc finger CCCH domain-containing protein 18, partial [Bienertia sinuspersici]
PVQNQGQTFRFDDLLDPMNVGFLGNHRSASLSDLPLKTCHYFSKGCYRHESDCRYIHGLDNCLSPVFSPNELGADDHIFSPRALKELDREVSELLKLRWGNPVSIASLPMLYYEMAHGQHDVILAEDTLKYSLDNRNERNDPSQIVSGSRQIYLTFKPESTFTEEDVSDYFGYSSPTVVFVNMHLIKIYSKLLLSFVLVAFSMHWKMLGSPAKQKQMFGFVTFGSAKPALCLRISKYMEKNDHGMYNLENYLELEHDFHHIHSKIPNAEQYYMMDAFNNCTISDDRSNHMGSDYIVNK